MRAWVGSWTGCAGRAGARPGACSPTTWRRASSGPRRRASRGRNARAAGTALAVSLGDAFPPGSLLRPGRLMACADACGHAEPDTVRAPQPSQATTARPARRSASPASRGGTRACPSSATSPATRPAPPAAARTIAEPGRPQGLRLPAPRLGHAPRSRARRHQEGRRGRALGRRGPRLDGPGGVFALAGTRRVARGKLLPPTTPETASRRSSRSPGGVARPCPSASRRRRPSGGACPCASWPLRRPG